MINDNVRGFPILKFDNDTLCVACEQGKQLRQGHPVIIDSKIVEPFEVLYIDLYGPSNVETLNKKRYILVIIDDFSQFTWVCFLKLKSDVAQTMIDFIKHIDTSLKKNVRKIKSDHGRNLRKMFWIRS